MFVINTCKLESNCDVIACLAKSLSDALNSEKDSTLQGESVMLNEVPLYSNSHIVQNMRANTAS